MSDGRAFTDYHPSCTLNKLLQEQYQVGNLHDYRYFLQKNADKIRMDMARCEPQQEFTLCPVCKQALESGSAAKN